MTISRKVGFECTAGLVNDFHECWVFSIRILYSLKSTLILIAELFKPINNGLYVSDKQDNIFPSHSSSTLKCIFPSIFVVNIILVTQSRELSNVVVIRSLNKATFRYKPLSNACCKHSQTSLHIFALYTCAQLMGSSNNISFDCAFVYFFSSTMVPSIQFHKYSSLKYAFTANFYVT